MGRPSKSPRSAAIALLARTVMVTRPPCVTCAGCASSSRRGGSGVGVGVGVKVGVGIGVLVAVGVGGIGVSVGVGLAKMFAKGELFIAEHPASVEIISHPRQVAAIV